MKIDNAQDSDDYSDDPAAPATLRKYLAWYFFDSGAEEFVHCDDYIDDPAAHPALRKYLAFARAPAHGLLLPKPHPTLFADYEGRRVRVTVASRFGDVGITTDLSAEFGYEERVLVSQLGNFAERP